MADHRERGTIESDYWKYYSNYYTSLCTNRQSEWQRHWKFYATIRIVIQAAYKNYILIGDYNAKTGKPKQNESLIMNGKPMDMGKK